MQGPLVAVDGLLEIEVHVEVGLEAAGTGARVKTWRQILRRLQPANEGLITSVPRMPLRKSLCSGTNPEECVAFPHSISQVY